MDHEDTASRPAPGWPPPHPSPPLPPPREYGVPGTPADWRPWLWGLLAGAVVVALVAVGLVVFLPGPGDDGDDAGRQPATSPTASDAASTAPPAPSPYRCWDGADAQKLKDCTDPTGVEGLRWVFPAMADEKCGADAKGVDGAVLRILCRHELGNGTKAAVGYFEWSSVEAAQHFYADQGLKPVKGKDPTGRPVSIRYFGVQGDQVKAVTLFLDEPLSSTITFPKSVTPTAEDVNALAPRPFEQLRGAPVG